VGSGREAGKKLIELTYSVEGIFFLSGGEDVKIPGLSCSIGQLDCDFDISAFHRKNEFASQFNISRMPFARSGDPV
jgi:hypothetical protein